MNRKAQAKRIHITGGAGSGKTTLAQQLSLHLDIPCYHLDKIAYEGGAGRKIPLDIRLKSIDAIIVQPGWVTEGAFLWWTEPLFEEADLILWLDLPFRINGWRIVKRHVQLSWAGTNPHAGLGKLIRFLAHVMQSQTTRTAIAPKAPDDDAAMTRAATAQVMGHYQGKVTRCTRPAEVAEFRTEFMRNREFS
jgi:adenylate kinase family enzyme